MKTKLVSKAEIESFKTYQAGRDKKNEGTREEKNSRKVLDITHPELNQKETEFSFIHNGKPIATWTSNPRMALDQAKLQAEFPEAYKACYLQGQAWTLDVLV